jgi:hypothetical protein
MIEPLPEPDLTIGPRASWEPLAWRCANASLFVNILLIALSFTHHSGALGLVAFILGLGLVVEGLLVMFNVRGAIYVIEGSNPGSRPRLVDVRSPYWMPTRIWSLFMVALGIVGLLAPLRM